MIYFDHAATSLGKPECVIEAVAQAMRTMGNPGRGSHAAALAAARTIYGTRKKLADFFGMYDTPESSAAERVIFTANATEGLNLVIKGLLDPGDHVITTVLEHNSVLRPLYEMEEKGVELTVLSCDARGYISLEELEAKVQEHTRAVICTHASNVTGNVNDIRKIGTICEKYNLYFILDAAQTAGSIAIDMKQDKVSALVFTGHKGLCGPQGTGGVCLAPGIKPRPLKSGGSGTHSFDRGQPQALPEALEAGTLHVHGIAGLSAALSFLTEAGGTERMHRQATEVFRVFCCGIRSIPGIRVLGDAQMQDGHIPLISLNVADIDAGEIADRLFEEYGIAVRAGVHCAPLLHRALGTAGQGAVRFSFSSANTAEEANAASSALAAIAKSYRGRVISYVGAGGKTGSIKADAAAFAKEGKKVLITTTTKMADADVREYAVAEIAAQLLEQPEQRYEDIVREVKAIFKKTSICAVGRRLDGEMQEQKFTMPPLPLLERLLYEADVILIEADGAAHKQIKAPETWEPVVLPFTDEVAVVMGAAAVGHKVKDVCHRETKVLEILSCDAAHRLTRSDLTKLMEEGYEKPVREKYPFMEFRKIYYQGDGR